MTTLSQTYSDCLKGQEGHAVYEKLTPEEMAPGTCGYVNENRDWIKIAQITDETSMNMLHLSYYPELTSKILSTNDTWPTPKTSTNIQGFSWKTDVKFDAAGLPVGGGTSFEYKKEDGQGAILIADGLIESARVEPTSVVNKWMKDNAKKILNMERFEDARKHGLWVVTKTYKTPRALLGVLDFAATKFSWSIEASAAGVGKIAPGVAWTKSHQEGTWVYHEDPKGVVVLFCGVQLGSGLFSKPEADRGRQKYSLPKHPSEIDAIAVEVPDPNGGGGTVLLELVPKEIGTVEGARFTNSYKSGEEEEDEE